MIHVYSIYPNVAFYATQPVFVDHGTRCIVMVIFSGGEHAGRGPSTESIGWGSGQNQIWCG